MEDRVSLEKIREKIGKGEYQFSDHAVKRMIERHIEPEEVEYVIIHGEVIESYPGDKYSPSCLVYGKTAEKRNLHVQVSCPPLVVVITTYEPDPEEWINGKTRK